MSRIKFALIIVIAVLLSGGTATAASRYLITSTRQISPHVLRQLRGSVGPAGPTGPTGSTGPQGPAGGLPSYSQAHTKETLLARGMDTILATCPSGYLPTGGGYTLNGPATVTTAVPSGNGYMVVVQAPDAYSVTVNVYAQCWGTN